MSTDDDFHKEVGEGWIRSEAHLRSWLVAKELKEARAKAREHAQALSGVQVRIYGRVRGGETPEEAARAQGPSVTSSDKS